LGDSFNVFTDIIIDWEALTGGYLLNACFVTGRAAGQGALSGLEKINEKFIEVVPVQINAQNAQAVDIARQDN